jgi:UDP-glucose 4-epimerase
MKALITGGAGFIGSHLAEALLERGDSVAVIDDLSTGSIRNIEHLKADKRFRYTIDSVMNVPVLAELVDDADVVFHLAAAVGVRLVVQRPVSTIETNVQGTENVLACANKKHKKVLLASTSEVYGRSVRERFSEDDDLLIGPPTTARWRYACSKALDEFLAMAYFKEKGLPVVIARLFNTVGPRQTGEYGMVVPSFVSRALASEPIQVYGDGRQSRCFCHVSDLVGALIALSEHADAVGQVFNIGSDDEITIRALAEQVKASLGSASDIVLVAYDDAYEAGFEDMRRRVPDISKVRRLIGFQPGRDLTTIIQDVAAHQRATW